MSGRILKINSEIQKIVSHIITYELKNPILSGNIISVTKADTTSDLELCKIYLSIFAKDKKIDILNQIKHSASFIRKNLSSKLNIRKVPYLEFYLDESIEYGAKIDAVLQKINEERKANEDEIN